MQRTSLHSHQPSDRAYTLVVDAYIIRRAVAHIERACYRRACTSTASSQNVACCSPCHDSISCTVCLPEEQRSKQRPRAYADVVDAYVTAAAHTERIWCQRTCTSAAI